MWPKSGLFGKKLVKIQLETWKITLHSKDKMQLYYLFFFFLSEALASSLVSCLGVVVSDLVLVVVPLVDTGSFCPVGGALGVSNNLRKSAFVNLWGFL